MDFNELFLIHFANAKNDLNVFNRDLDHGAGFFSNNIKCQSNLKPHYKLILFNQYVLT